MCERFSRKRRLDSWIIVVGDFDNRHLQGQKRRGRKRGAKFIFYWHFGHFAGFLFPACNKAFYRAAGFQKVDF